ncbi:MAG: hydrogenase iron-sulfur subunit [Bacteroidales bacterium]|nr:MAG: hydrogenase iron-sulfur subunit [Bacteroidales bacterium]
MKTFSLKIILFYCSNSINPDEITKYLKKDDEIEIRIISLPCSGKVDLLYLLKAIETGTEGVFLITCMMGNCQNLEGNLRAKKRADAVNAILEETGMGKERVILIPASETTDSDYIYKEIIKFRDQIKEIPRKEKLTVQETK